MGHVVARETWGVLDLDTTEGRIFFQQDWFYVWEVAGGTPWTTEQRRHFHNTADRQIWASWSNRLRFTVTGASDFARRFAGRGVPINFDIHWVLRPGHWEVHVRKLPAGSTPTTFISNVDFPNRRINLDSADLGAYNACNASGNCNANFRAVPHEFGHTFPSNSTAAQDEYNAGNANLADTASILNVGSQVRRRHLQNILEILNRPLIRNATFSFTGA